MEIVNLNVNSEKINNVTTWIATPEIRIDTKSDVIMIQKMQLLETDLTLIPTAYYNMIRRLDKEIATIISERYPEWLLSNQKILEEIHNI